MTRSNIDQFLDALRARGCDPRKIRDQEWRCPCPAHGGKNDNLKISLADDGKILLCCHSKKCSAEQIAASVGLEMSNLMPVQTPARPNTESNTNGQPVKAVAKRSANTKLRHRVYTSLSNRLGMHESHQNNLATTRHLSRENVARLRSEANYAFIFSGSESRSKVAGQVASDVPEADLTTIPGFKLLDDGQLTLSGWSGLWVPIRNRVGQIMSFQVRVNDERAMARGKWHSPKGSRQAVHHPVASFAADDRSTIRVTEGVLKADLATLLSGVFTLGAPGLSMRSALKSIKLLKPNRVLIAMDAEYESNPAVAQAILDVVIGCRRLKITPAVETWSRELGKGIDDVLVNMRTDQDS